MMMLIDVDRLSALKLRTKGTRYDKKLSGASQTEKHNVLL